MEKISSKDSLMQEEDKLKDDKHGEIQEVEVEPTQLLLKDWRYTTNHPKELIIGDVSKGVTTRSKLYDIFDHYAFISHIKPKNILEAEECKKSSIDLNITKFGTLFLDPMIGQSLALNEFLGISWMSQKMSLRIKLG